MNMSAIISNRGNYDRLHRLIRIARGLEAEGYYNAGKLCWALAFSQEIRATNDPPLPRARTSLAQELSALVDDLKADGLSPALEAAFDDTLRVVREDRTGGHLEVCVCRRCGEVFVSRSDTQANPADLHVVGQIPARCPTCGADALTFHEIAPIWYFEPLPPSKLVAALEENIPVVASAADGMSDAQLVQAPAPGEWSMRELLFHFLFAEGLLAGRLEKILSENNPSLAGSAAWAIHDQEELSAAELIERFRTSRQATLARLRGATPGDWWRTGVHSEFGQITLAQHVTYFVRHERLHFLQIDEIRQAVGVS
jgi:hypothetical protein